MTNAGGTGPSPRDLTPEATLAACPREMPGFGELMRQVSLAKVPTAILSRQLAGIRGKSLIVRSRIVHAGKTIAVVRTEVKNDAGARVLEVVTHHVARKRA